MRRRLTAAQEPGAVAGEFRRARHRHPGSGHHRQGCVKQPGYALEATLVWGSDLIGGGNAMIVDAGALYEKAAELAERAVALDPDSGFALTDLVEDELALANLFAEPATCLIVIQGVLDGCLTAFRSYAVAPKWLANIENHPPAPPQVQIGSPEFESAIEWLRQGALHKTTPGELTELIYSTITGWSTSTPEETAMKGTGQVLALIVVADAVCTASRQLGSP